MSILHEQEPVRVLSSSSFPFSWTKPTNSKLKMALNWGLQEAPFYIKTSMIWNKLRKSIFISQSLWLGLTLQTNGIPTSVTFNTKTSWKLWWLLFHPKNDSTALFFNASCVRGRTPSFPITSRKKMELCLSARTTDDTRCIQPATTACTQR